MFFVLLTVLISINGVITQNESECDAEEPMIETCALKFFIMGRRRVPQSMTEIDLFCTDYPKQEKCLREHSQKCLPSSGHQSITMLINDIDTQNDKICNSRNSKRIMIRAARCVNLVIDEFLKCIDHFGNQIQGIHQLTQEEKMPVICCNYHQYLKCSVDILTSVGEPICNKLSINTIDKIITAYAGDVLNYVCADYNTNESGKRCESAADFGGNLLNGNDNGNGNKTEPKPKSLMDLYVKIYLS